MSEQNKIIPILYESQSPAGGFNVRLPNEQIKRFPTSTIVQERLDESIDILFDHIHLAHYAKGEFLSFFPTIAANCRRTKIRWHGDRD